MPADWLARSRLTARQLSLLVALDEKGSLLQAAEATHMSQPAASRLLRSIEDALDVALFERHPRGVVPTAYGEVVVRHAHAALAEFRQAHEEVAALASGIAGTVRIGTAITSAIDLVAMAVARLASEHPHVRVQIELAFSEALVHQLVERNLDIAIVRLHPSHAVNGLEFRALGEERHGIVVRGGHPLAREQALSLADVASCTWVVPPPGNVMRDKLTLLFLQQGIRVPDQVVETLALPVIISLLGASDMVAPLPIDVVRPHFDTGTLARLPVRFDLQLGAAGIVTRRGGKLSPAAKALIDQLSAAAGKLYPRRRR